MSKILYAKSAPEWTTLKSHTQHVILAAVAFANHLGMDTIIARNGAILHDLGKAHDYFQNKRLKGEGDRRDIFRHEIASLFFLSAFPKAQWDELIEMVIGHHKSVRNDINELGLLDLEEAYDYIDDHIKDWEIWSLNAINFLNEFGFSCHFISSQEALENIRYTIEYCAKATSMSGYSEWRGLLMGADHFASSLIDKTEFQTNRIFRKPILAFYKRQNSLYPLSLIKADVPKQHTLIVACTGSGKTDFLLRRCRGRIFYLLPFQASINAMFKRIGKDLERDNPDIDIRVLHSTSILVNRSNREEVAMQNLIGSAVKILTPHQLASIAFGMKGYEAMILDLKNCDVILDEVHTYSGISQALVLKIIEVLIAIGCKIHVGTATMPTILYHRIKQLLGDDVLEVKLTEDEQEKFNRHIVHKLPSFSHSKKIIECGIKRNLKVLIVLNTVNEAQEVYRYIRDIHPEIPTLLLHSKFKRCDRNVLERQLMGLDDNGLPMGIFNTSKDACIVVSTQIVEVSLDISFDLMITSAAPLDALIQRFGRVNRVRNLNSFGRLKDVYVIAPPQVEMQARPYELNVLQKSYEILKDGQVLKESELQSMIDKVYKEIDFLRIEEHCVFKSNGKFIIDKLTHRSKAILFQLLEIESVSCILDSDIEAYEQADLETRLGLEISVGYWSVAKMDQSKKGNKPFIIPKDSYDVEIGLDTKKIHIKNINVQNQII